jgi:hypothetical protein
MGMLLIAARNSAVAVVEASLRVKGAPRQTQQMYTTRDPFMKLVLVCCSIRLIATCSVDSSALTARMQTVATRIGFTDSSKAASTSSGPFLK